jgi:hypothetical protein
MSTSLRSPSRPIVHRAIEALNTTDKRLAHALGCDVAQIGRIRSDPDAITLSQWTTLQVMCQVSRSEDARYVGDVMAAFRRGGMPSVPTR